MNNKGHAFNSKMYFCATPGRKLQCVRINAIPQAAKSRKLK